MTFEGADVKGYDEIVSALEGNGYLIMHQKI